MFHVILVFYFRLTTSRRSQIPVCH